MTIKTYKTLIILLRLDKWSYILTGLFILSLFFLDTPNKLIIASFLLIHLIARKVIVFYLRKGLHSKLE